MAEHPNAELWRKGQEAFSRGDLDTVRSSWDDDIVYHFPGASPIAGDHKGKDGVLAFLAKVAEMSQGTFRISEVHDVLANDQHVVALLTMTATRKGKQLTWDQANIYHIRNGKTTEVWGVPVDQRALDELLS